MAKKKKDSIEYRYYEIGQDECVLALFGESWIRDYGHDVDGFHFHNLMEVGVCHEGRGDMSYEEGNVPYAPGTITVKLKSGYLQVHCLDRSLSEGLGDSSFVRILREMEAIE